jgi:hypothetical protein
VTYVAQVKIGNGDRVDDEVGGRAGGQGAGEEEFELHGWYVVVVCVVRCYELASEGACERVVRGFVCLASVLTKFKSKK